MAASNAYHDEHGSTCQETYYNTGKPCPCAKDFRKFLKKDDPPRKKKR